ncbi:MAG: flagellar hook-basal body complex protein [Neomegalonema sp.]|nr:flagellar hook-basal body complex protein [Neomegalonema sp.]
MDNALYVNVTRQSALLDELQSIANNLANMNTDGFRREAPVFSEYVKAVEGPVGSLSMAAARGHFVDETQGALAHTGGSFDLAIEGEGYFMLESPDGAPLLTRAGSFTPNEANELVTSDGVRVLDASGGPIFIPPDAAEVKIAGDGSISADGNLIGQVGLFTAPPESLKRTSGMSFTTDEAPLPVEGTGKIAQGYLEQSNVSAVTEITRLVEVQRAYELASSFGNQEDGRIENLIQTLSRPA